jgi:NADH-quinone oxidoreductase subunit L
MESFLHLFLALPILGFVISLVIPARNESALSKVAFAAVGLSLLSIMVFIAAWAMGGFHSYNVQDLSLYKTPDYDFFIDFYFDKITAVYLFVGAILTFMVTIYSRYYLHRESGYKRFFNTILFFYTGYNLVVMSGNFETLFIGWEILGISSFLLIAFYRERYMPVKNALKVFTIYRIGDVGLLLAMWMSHHLFHLNVRFDMLTDYAYVSEHLVSHSVIGVFISIMILLAASAKSAQLPFTSWLPRAMEGPTPSSAIFYGSLSVHIGAFLLLRTFPFWEHQISVRIVIGFVGLTTAIISSQIARVQSSIKSQVAYSSASQIGLIFIEIAMGLDILALVHFAGNAFLRSYQLLISPSVITYLIREQFYEVKEEEEEIQRVSSRKWRNTFYLLALKEWHLDSVVFTLFFNPLKKLRKILDFITMKNLLFFFVPMYLVGLFFSYQNKNLAPDVKNIIATLIAFLALIMVAKAYNERSSSRLAWLLIVLAHFFIDLAIGFNDHFDAKEATIYLSGVIISGIVGYFCLQQVKAFEHHGIGLNQFHGLVRNYKTLAFVFLLACLGLAGFPITTTFFGEDIILTHIKENQVVLAFFVAIAFVINGIAVVRIYARVFLGPHPKNYQDKYDLTS